MSIATIVQVVVAIGNVIGGAVFIVQPVSKLIDEKGADSPLSLTHWYVFLIFSAIIVILLLVSIVYLAFLKRSTSFEHCGPFEPESRDELHEKLKKISGTLIHTERPCANENSVELVSTPCSRVVTEQLHRMWETVEVDLRRLLEEIDRELRSQPGRRNREGIVREVLRRQVDRLLVNFPVGGVGAPAENCVRYDESVGTLIDMVPFGFRIRQNLYDPFNSTIDMMDALTKVKAAAEELHKQARENTVKAAEWTRRLDGRICAALARTQNRVPTQREAGKEM